MYRIRSGVDSDIDEIFELHVALFRPFIEEIWGWDGEWQRNNFEAEWHSSRTEVIEDDGRGIGYLETQMREDPPHLYVLNLAIMPEYQNRGIGSRIMNSLMQRSADLGRPIRLNVFAGNEGAFRLYSRLGFRAEETSEHGTILGWSSVLSPQQETGEPNACETTPDKPPC